MWLILALCSSVFLGLYDLLKKSSLKNNSFIPVLFFATFSAALLFCFIIISSRTGIICSESILYVPQIGLQEHLLFFLKSIIVGSSWFLAYMALSKLPITIVVPIRATGPFWTLLGALFIFNERFNLLQWSGIIIILIFFYVFSLAGKKEGINFLRNKWIIAIVGATILGAASSLYDKYLLLHYNRMAVQAWFSVYMVVVLFPFLVLRWYPTRNISPTFKWRWKIPAIGLVLSIADFLYFYALSNTDSLIAIVSVIRRSSVVISFTLGAIIFKENNIKRKALALAVIIIGVIILLIGSHSF